MIPIKSDPQKTAITIVAGLLIVHFLAKNNGFLYVAMAISVLTAFSARIAVFIEKIWFKVAELLGSIIPKIMLSIIFFLFLTPIAVFRKIVSRDNLLQLKKGQNSLWIERKKHFSPLDMDKPW